MILRYGPHKGKYLAECPLAYIIGMANGSGRLAQHARYIIDTWTEYDVLYDNPDDYRIPF